jgi:hypothetical protein
VSSFNVLLLPLDVANQNGQFQAVGGLPMGTIDEAFFIATVCMAVAIVPFTMFYYEGVDDADDYDGNRCVLAKWSTRLV